MQIGVHPIARAALVRLRRVMRAVPIPARVEPERAQGAPKFDGGSAAESEARKASRSMVMRSYLVSLQMRRRGESAHERREPIVEHSQRARIALRRRDKVASDKYDDRVHQRRDRDEAEAEPEQFHARMGITRADELRQEGYEEEHDLRIGEVDEQPVRESAAQTSSRRALRLNLRTEPSRIARQASHSR